MHFSLIFHKRVFIWVPSLKTVPMKGDQWIHYQFLQVSSKLLTLHKIIMCKKAISDSLGQTLHSYNNANNIKKVTFSSYRILAYFQILTYSRLRIGPVCDFTTRLPLEPPYPCIVNSNSNQNITHTSTHVVDASRYKSYLHSNS